VHRYFQMAAAPHFFACSQRTQLLASILHAPREAGGAGLSLAQLQRDKVISKAFPLHDHDERKVRVRVRARVRVRVRARVRVRVRVNNPTLTLTLTLTLT